MPDLPDRFGPFIVVGAVGSGGMGEVYRARDPRLNREVAIKVLARAGSDPVRQRRFTDEAQAASALNHPNILTVHDVGVHAEVPYIVSELVDGRGRRLGDVLGSVLPLPLLSNNGGRRGPDLRAEHAFRCHVRTHGQGGDQRRASPGGDQVQRSVSASASRFLRSQPD